jgi:2-polyprenyl-3-methyl-5-hydroxy-6-metoxy-1,4-benzoquinol methylase
MEKFSFTENDEIGEQTLEVISGAERFNRWMFTTIQPYCRGKILEIGSGIGNISAFFLQEQCTIMLSDVRENYCHRLRNRFEKTPGCLGVEQLDLLCVDFSQKYHHLLQSFDTVFALNVIEHISDDQLAIRNAKQLLKTGGRLIILVPAYPALYNQFDKNLGHYRRYTKKTARRILKQSGLTIIHSWYFNFMGIAGWFISGKLQKNSQIPGRQMNLYDKLVPLFKVVDKIVLNKIGLSVIVVGENKN